MPLGDEPLICIFTEQSCPRWMIRFSGTPFLRRQIRKVRHDGTISLNNNSFWGAAVSAVRLSCVLTRTVPYLRAGPVGQAVPVNLADNAHVKERGPCLSGTADKKGWIGHTQAFYSFQPPLARRYGRMRLIPLYWKWRRIPILKRAGDGMLAGTGSGKTCPASV